MSGQQKSLLAIVEQGGYPDFTSLYESLGYQVVTTTTMRKALALIKQHKPDIITAEFIYSPMYSARISNLESLFAALQSQQLNPQLFIFIDKEEMHHLNKLEMQHYVSRALCYPINEEQILNCLNVHSSVS